MAEKLLLSTSEKQFRLDSGSVVGLLQKARHLVAVKFFNTILLLLVSSVALKAEDAPVKTSSRLKQNAKKIQEVNFSEMSLQGTVRNPDGSYLVQKKGIKFLPLHEVKKNMDSKIRESHGWLE